MSAKVPSTVSGAGRICGGSQPNRALAAQRTRAASGARTARPAVASAPPGRMAARWRTRSEAISGRDRLAARVEARPEVLKAKLFERHVQVAGLEPAGRVDVAADQAV